MESIVPIIDVQAYLDKTPGKWEQECKKVAESLHQFGILIFKDPRINDQDNDEYLDLMETYFALQSQKRDRGIELKDSRPDLNF
jgi:isopenicillin N synthase-like dioxygenase